MLNALVVCRSTIEQKVLIETILTKCSYLGIKQIKFDVIKSDKLQLTFVVFGDLTSFSKRLRGCRFDKFWTSYPLDQNTLTEITLCMRR